MPVYGEATETFAFPVDFGVVGFEDGVDEVHGVVFAEIFDSKVVDAENECCWSGFVFSEARGEGNGVVSVLV